jgi:hypothetical protein
MDNVGAKHVLPDKIKRRENILSKTNNCQSKCPIRDKTLVEREAKPNRLPKPVRFTMTKNN